MDLELHQLDLRYEELRRRAPEREKRLLASLAQQGQQLPIVIVGDARVVVDGYKRVRALRQLKVDTVLATAWQLAEADALLLERLMRAGDGDDAFEQGWLVRELQERFGLTQEELARRFDKSISWVCRRLSLVQELPEEIQERVRRGGLVAHSAMKYLVPLARANRSACLRLVAALGTKKPSSRQVGALYSAWMSGNPKTRELLLADPWLFLRALDESRRAQDVEKSPAQQLLSDFGALGGIARRARSRLQQGVARGLLPSDREEVHRCLCQAKADAEALFSIGRKELEDARPEAAGCDSRIA
jgi:ParB family transcriptional regulator, chromosome partitioning protein